MLKLTVRWIGCTVSLFAASAVFLGRMEILPSVLAALLLTIFYLLLRPILQTLILPGNLLLFGLLTPLTDALLVLWAASVCGIGLCYWQSVLTALLVSLMDLPMSVYTRKRLPPKDH